MRALTPTGWLKLGLLIAAVIVAFALPYVISPFLVSIVTLAVILGLFAMSIDLLAGYGGLVTLGQGGIMAAAAYGVGYVAVRADGGHLAQVLVGLLVGILVTAIFALISMRTTGIYFIMVTLAGGMTVWGLSIRLISITGAENGLRGILRPPAIAAYWEFYYVCVAVLLLCGGLLYVVVRSPFGLALRGLRESEGRLRMLGYNSTLQKAYAFMVSGFFATIAGILYVYNNQFISPSVAEFLSSANGILMVILGGVGTLVGPVVGAFVIVFTENVVSSYIERWPTFLGALFVVVILFARGGFVGFLSRAWRTLLRLRSTDAGADERGAERESKTSPLRTSTGMKEEGA